MKKIISTFFLIVCAILNAQRIAEVGKYSMSNPKKSYNIIANYNENLELKQLLIDLDSEDAIFDNSTLFLKQDQLNIFIEYLNYILIKKKEWDAINVKNKTLEVVKKIDYDKDVNAGLVYKDGPVITNTYLYTMYAFVKNKSGVVITAVGTSEVKPSSIEFPSTESLQNFINKISKERIVKSIAEEQKKQSLLK